MNVSTVTTATANLSEEYDSEWDVYWYEKNLQGDIVAVYDEMGVKLVSYVYDAFGNATVTYHNGGASTTVVNNPFCYRGYYYDQDLGMYYLQTRYYDPVIGRFISADNQIAGVGGSILGYNMFAYCFNNPVNLVDPTGHWPSWATKLTIAVGIVAVVAIVAVATAGTGTVIACVAAGAAKGAAIGLASGAAMGAASGAIGHRLTTGSWEGADEAALNGMADGALSGAITGAIAGGIKGGINHFSTKVDPRISDALSALNRTGIKPGQSHISQKRVLAIYNSYNPTVASSAYTNINGVIYVSDGHHTMIANVMKYGKLTSGANMGQVVNDPTVLTNLLWTTLKIMP